MSLHTQQNGTLNNHCNDVHTSDGIEVPSHYKWGNGLYSYAHPVFQESSHLSDSLKKKEKMKKSSHLSHVSKYDHTLQRILTRIRRRSKPEFLTPNTCTIKQPMPQLVCIPE